MHPNRRASMASAFSNRASLYIPHCFIWFDCCPPFLLLCVAFVVLVLVLVLVLALVFLPGLYSAACRTGLPFLRNLLRRMFFSCSTRISLSTTSYKYVVVFVSSAFFAFACVLLVFSFVFCLFVLSLMCPFLATMSFAGYFLARFIMSALFLRPTVFPVGLDLVSSIV